MQTLRHLDIAVRPSSRSLLRRVVSLSLAAFCCVCLLVATERQAYAYIDPGSGLLALQSFFAGLAAAGYFLRRRIGLLFGRGKKQPANATSAVVIAKPVASLQKDNTRSAA